jgi:hypothetical protein
MTDKGGQETRVCAACEKPLVQKTGERPARFRVRATCGSSCGSRLAQMNRKRVPVEERFWAKVDKDGPVPAACPELGKCWMWTAAAAKRGYGTFNRGPDNGMWTPAHRFAFELVRGPVAADAVHLHHLCKTPRCVNPNHLLPVSYAEHGLQHRATHCFRGHELAIHGSYRRGGTGPLVYCRACRRRGS